MKMITEYEVEGCWTDNEASYRLNNPTRCRACGTPLELTPKTEHANSKYWKLQREDGLYLYCCPEGCSDKYASELMHIYLGLAQHALKEGSASYSWEADLESVENAWIDPDGIVYPVVAEGHRSFAEKILHTNEQLLEKTWIKISSVSNEIAFDDKENTKKQKEALFDFFIANDYDTKRLYDETHHGIYYRMVRNFNK